MAQYEVVLSNIPELHKDTVVLALYHAGYSVYKTSDNEIAFTTTDDDITKIKD